jgi:hypothetical protein
MTSQSVLFEVPYLFMLFIYTGCVYRYPKMKELLEVLNLPAIDMHWSRHSALVMLKAADQVDINVDNLPVPCVHYY